MKKDLDALTESQYISIVQKIGKENHTFKYKHCKPVVRQQYKLINWESYPSDIDALIYLFKGLVLCERDFQWIGGSAATNIRVFTLIQSHSEIKSNQKKLNELIDWAVKNRGNNPYTPFGSVVYSRCRSIADVLILDRTRARARAAYEKRLDAEKKQKIKRKKIQFLLDGLRKNKGVIKKRIYELNVELFMLKETDERFRLLLSKKINFPVNFVPMNCWQEILERKLNIHEINKLLAIIPKNSSRQLKEIVKPKLLDKKKISSIPSKDRIKSPFFSSVKNTI
tara:strand:- start:1098 stop:1943 length:846 start_codon:yes stop_codon:yes gene_type:complete